MNTSQAEVLDTQIDLKAINRVPDNCYFVTSITKYRIPFFLVSMFRDSLIKGINYFREKYGFKLHGYVAMPDHLHALLTVSSESGSSISAILRNIKSYSGREISRILGDRGKVWENGFIKQEITTPEDFKKFLDLMHENPVKRGLVRNSADYPYSSYRFYNNGEEGPVKIDLIEMEVMQ